MQMHPQMMELVLHRGMSSHPSLVGTRDQIYAHFLEHLKVCTGLTRSLDNEERYRLIAAMDYAVGICRLQQFSEAEAYVATVVAALLLESGAEVVLDDDSGDRTDL